MGLKKPTLFSLNEFTSTFQLIVDTYGVPSYKEVNPAFFTIVSFPFFFGVMFGDIMHGAIIAVFSMYLCMADKKPGTVAGAFAPMRYILLLMGLNAFYCGLIYNDFTSMTTSIVAKTCYKVEEDAEKVAGNDGFYYATQEKDCVYPFGIDPTWYRATQEVSFMNSLKMKASVVFGVVQMLIGTSMKGMNALYFGRYVEFIFDVIAQLVLLSCLFGFMDLAIFKKWTTDWAAVQQETGQYAPSIINTMIIMVINGGVEPPPEDGKPGFAPVFENQTALMQNLLVIALITIPSMLLVNPICASRKHKKPSNVGEEIEMN